MRVMLSEMSTEDTEARMLSIWASADSIGIFIAPIAGGLLARPAEQYDFFKHSTLFQDYPYLLPSLLMGALGGSCTLLCIFGLKEVRSVSSGLRFPMTDHYGQTLVKAPKAGIEGNTGEQITYSGLLKLPDIPYVLVNSTCLQMLVFAWIASGCHVH